ncbi:MAG: hypothetical protein K0S39_5632 [Paenibacillus sp.]|jgi:hypothetical protein|nr:hypothetical protein [Paenibacillus sp.]
MPGQVQKHNQNQNQKLFETVKANWETKLTEIRSRMTFVIRQLTDEQVNWRPDGESNSIANLILHIEGNIHQRIESAILGGVDRRDRDGEFDNGVYAGVEELTLRLEKAFDLLLKTVSAIKAERLLDPIQIRGKQVTVYDVINQCASHFSEHLGQVLYLAKMQLGERYTTTSIPKKK